MARAADELAHGQTAIADGIGEAHAEPGSSSTAGVS